MSWPPNPAARFLRIDSTGHNDRAQRGPIAKKYPPVGGYRMDQSSPLSAKDIDVGVGHDEVIEHPDVHHGQRLAKRLGEQFIGA